MFIFYLGATNTFFLITYKVTLFILERKANIEICSSYVNIWLSSPRHPILFFGDTSLTPDNDVISEQPLVKHCVESIIWKQAMNYIQPRAIHYMYYMTLCTINSVLSISTHCHSNIWLLITAYLFTYTGCYIFICTYFWFSFIFCLTRGLVGLQRGEQTQISFINSSQSR